ncbi:MAG: DUF2723 domain-containing protein [Candidatus Riflebacteria bacterium]|nr:DUF2723 domain-containing protein [Candidatus Riflebacteria bacterium]
MKNTLIFFVLTFFTGLLMFLPTLQTGVGWYNSGELTVAAMTLDVPHSPGYPLFTRLGNIFLRLPLNCEPVLKINLMSAILASSAGAFFFLFLKIAGISTFYSFCSAIWLFSFSTFWEQSTGAEVYTLEILLLGTFFCLSWEIIFNAKNSRLYFFLWGMNYSLGVGHRPTFFLLTIGILLLLARQLYAKKVFLKPENISYIVFGLVVGFIPSVDLYFRLQNPERVLTDPSLGQGISGFIDVFSAKEFRKGLGVFTLPELLLRFREWLLLMISDGRITAVLLPVFLLKRSGRVDPQVFLFSLILVVNSLFIINFNAFEASTMLLPSMMALTGLSAHAMSKSVRSESLYCIPTNVLASDDCNNSRRVKVEKYHVKIAFAVMVAVSVFLSSQKMEPRSSDSELWVKRLLFLLPYSSTVLINNDIEFRPIWYLRQAKKLRTDINLRLVDDISESDVVQLKRESDKGRLFGTLVYPYDIRSKIGKYLDISPHGYLSRISPGGSTHSDYSQIADWKSIKINDSFSIFFPEPLKSECFTLIKNSIADRSDKNNLKNGDVVFFRYAVKNYSPDCFVLTYLCNEKGEIPLTNGVMTAFDINFPDEKDFGEKRKNDFYQIFKRSIVIPDSFPHGKYFMKMLIGKKDVLNKTDLIIENIENLPWLNANGATEVFILKNAMSGKPFIKASNEKDLKRDALWLNFDNPILLDTFSILNSN